MKQEGLSSHLRLSYPGLWSQGCLCQGWAREGVRPGLWVRKTIKPLTWPTQHSVASPSSLSCLPPSLHPVHCSRVHTLSANLGSKCLSFTNKVMNNKSEGFLGTISLYLWHLKTVNGPCNSYWEQFNALAASQRRRFENTCSSPHAWQIFMPGLVRARSQKSSSHVIIIIIIFETHTPIMSQTIMKKICL